MTLKLHTPTQLGDLSLRNRIVMSPMTRTRNEPGHVPGALVVEHYADRADAGLIVTECTSVSADASAFGDDPGIYNEAQVAGWKRVTDAVHAKGGLIALQIWHPGRATHPFLNNGAESISSTNRAIRDDGIHTPKGTVPQANPRALRTDEIPGIVAQFKAGAENARRAGFDAIQIHGAHGYLIDQFLRSSVNDRSDQYGGTLENRARLLLEITDAVIGVFGAGRVGVRISPLVAYNDISDADPQALVAYVAEQYAKRGTGFFELRHNDHSKAEELELARIARAKLGSVPLLRNGGYGGADGDEDVVAGRADAIVYGKPFIANPDLVERLAIGAELNAVDFTTLYAGGAKGYNDYPRLAS